MRTMRYIFQNRTDATKIYVKSNMTKIYIRWIYFPLFDVVASVGHHLRKSFVNFNVSPDKILYYYLAKVSVDTSIILALFL